MLQSLSERQLYAKFSKCKFLLNKIAFLGRVVLVNGILVDLSKIKVILEWLRPKTAKKVKIFLGLVGYYKSLLRISPSQPDYS